MFENLMKKLKISALKHRIAAGFTLIEVCIATVILGLIMMGAIKYYQHYERDKLEGVTRANIALATEQIEKFLAENWRYPCPAPLGADRMDDLSGYGRETDCANTTIGAGFCQDTPSGQNSYCIQESPNGALANRRVRIGAIPFRLTEVNLAGPPPTTIKRPAVNIAEENTYDGYGSKLYYAVTESLTNTATYSDYTGGIEVINENGVALSDPPASVKFVVFSVGENRIGGYDESGHMTSCYSRDTGDDENCDFLRELDATVPVGDPAYPTFLPNTKTEARFMSAGLNYSDATNCGPTNDQGCENDDTLSFSSTVNDTQPGGWRLGMASQAENPNDVIVNKDIVIGNPDVALNHTLQVEGESGDIYSTSLIKSDEYCKADGSGCFKVTDLTGTCPPGTYVTGIGGGGDTESKVLCNPLYYGCNPEEVLAGRDPDTGFPKCVARPPLPGGAGGEDASSGTDGGSSGTAATAGTGATAGTDGGGSTAGTDGGSTDGTAGTTGTPGTSGTPGTYGTEGGTTGETEGGTEGTPGTYGTPGTEGTEATAGTTATTGTVGTSTTGTTGTSSSTTGTGSTTGTSSSTTTGSTTSGPTSEPKDPTCLEESKSEYQKCPNVDKQYRIVQVKDCKTNTWRPGGSTQTQDCCDLPPTLVQTYQCKDHNGYAKGGTFEYHYNRYVSTNQCTWQHVKSVYKCDCKTDKITSYGNPACSNDADKTSDLCAVAEGQMGPSPWTPGWCDIISWTAKSPGTCKPAKYSWKKGSAFQTLSAKEALNLTKVGESCSMGDAKRVCVEEKGSDEYTQYRNCSCTKDPENCRAP